LIVAAPGANEGIPDSAGRVFAIPGRADWSTSATLWLRDARLATSATRENAIRVFRGAREFDRIGESLGTGDLNGDGITDLLIGVDHEDVLVDGKGQFNYLEVGRIHLLSGQNVFPATPPAMESILDATASDTILTGKSEFDLFGDHFLTTDWNRDGIDDVWVSAPCRTRPRRERHRRFRTSLSCLGRGLPPSYDRETTFYFLEGGMRQTTRRKTVTVCPKETLANGRRRDPLSIRSALIVDPKTTNGGKLPDRWRGRSPGGRNWEPLGASQFDSLGGSDQDGGLVVIVSRRDLVSATPGTPLQLEFTAPTGWIEGEEDGDRFGFRWRPEI
jgi:hypothetical protein